MMTPKGFVVSSIVTVVLDIPPTFDEFVERESHRHHRHYEHSDYAHSNSNANYFEHFSLPLLYVCSASPQPATRPEPSTAWEEGRYGLGHTYHVYGSRSPSLLDEGLCRL